MEPQAPLPGGPVPGAEELWGHGRFLRAVARGLVADEQRADDLVQDTWAVALEHPPRHGAAPRAWLARILRRLAIRRGTRESERGPIERAATLARPAAESRAPDALLAELELARRVLASVEGLREPYRETVYLRYYRALAPRDIAAEQGVPVKTVKTRLARGLQLLREDLDRQHGGRRETWIALLLPLARAPLGPPPALARPASVPVPLSLSPAVLSAALLLSAAGVAAVLWLRASGTSREANPRPGSAPVSAVDSAPLVPTRSDPRARQPVRTEVEVPEPAPVRARLTGRVVRGEGEPLAGAEVLATRFDSGRGGSSWGRGRFLETGPEDLEESRALTDAEGEFALELSGSGLVRLTAELDGYAPSARKLLVFLGQDLDLGTIPLDPGVFLSGRVLGPDGAPVSGAELFALREDDGLLVEPVAHRERVAATDEQGRFRLARQAVGPWDFEVESARHAPARASGHTDVPGERVLDLEVELVAGASVSGRVFGLEPGQRASVLLRAAEEEGGAPGPGRLRRVELDERGAFDEGTFRPGEPLELLVLAEGGPRALLVSPRRVHAGGEPLELWVGGEPARAAPFRREGTSELEPEELAEASGAVHLLVRAPDGQPVAGALIARASDQGEGRRRRALPEIRVTDRRGRLTWSGLPEGPQRFRVIAGVFGDEQDSPSGWEEARVVSGEPVELALTSAPRCELSGSVRVAGRPLAEAEILLRPVRADETWRGAGPALRVRSDLRGRYVFRDLPLGTYRLQLFHPERARPTEREVVLGLGRNDGDLELEDARIRGVVRDAEGRPVAGASVQVLPESAPLSPRSWPEADVPRRIGGTRTETDGTFELAGLEAGRVLRLEIGAEGLATARTAELSPDSFEEVRLAPEARLRLELSGTGEPFLLLRAAGPDGSTRTLGLPGGRSVLLRGLAPGAWRLELLTRGRGSEPRALAERTLTLAVGDNSLSWSVP